MISSRCTYALKAMLELAKQEKLGGKVTIADIAREQEIPTRFLEAILRQLKQAGLTISVRGKDGGYYLAKPAAQIRVGDVIRLFQEPLTPSSNGKCAVFDEIWEQAENALSDVYDAVDFATLVEKEELKKEFIANYAI